MTDRYRVAQWGTGHSGMASLRALIAHPRFDLVGVYVYSSEKEGRDAGDLCGTEPTGIVATRDIDDIIAAQPDCVVYMPATYDTDDLCWLLESGANISTLLEHFHDPESLDPSVRQRLESACERGGASLCSTGPSPGFITEALPLVLTTLERRLERLTIHEYADMSERDSPEMLAMLFGGQPESVDIAGIAHGAGLAYGSSLRRLANELSMPLDDVVTTAEVAVAKTPVATAVGTFDAGTVAAWQLEVNGMRAGKPVLQMVPTWYLTPDLDPAFDIPFPGQGWHVVVEGDAPLDVTVRFAWATDEERTLVGYGNGNRPVNAVPTVCAARPGIVTTIELPQIVADLG